MRWAGVGLVWFVALALSAGYAIATTPCVIDGTTAQQVRKLALEAVEQGFRDHVEKLYEVWMREPKPDQPQRIQRGMDKAIAAYLYGKTAIERWQPAC